MTRPAQAPASLSGKPHIAFVLPGLRAGGSEHIVSLLCNHFSRRGWSVSLFTFEEPGSPPYYAHDPEVRIVQLGYPAARLPAFHFVRALWRRIAALREAFKDASPDLVVSFLTRTNVVSILAARPLRIPVIVSERNNPAQQRHGAFWSTLRRLTYARAHGLITMTEGAMNQFPKAIRRSQWVIPNPTYAPVDVDPGRPSGKQLVAAGR